MKAINWFLYVARCADGTLYTGVTTDIDRRLNEHNSGSKGAKYTKTRRPITLVYSTAFKGRSEAQKAEYAFKRLTRKEKLKVIDANR